MTTYNATAFSSTIVTTDLQLYFEMTRNIYRQDPEFTERWSEWIVDMVKERLWTYSDAVMTTALGEEIFEGVIEELEEKPLKEVYKVFAREEDRFWTGRVWVDNFKGEDNDEDEEMSECDECGEEQPLASFNVVEYKDCIQKCFCDDCFDEKIERGEIGEVDGEWVEV